MTAYDLLLSDLDREMLRGKIMVKGLDMVFDAMARPIRPPEVHEPYDTLNDEIAERLAVAGCHRGRGGGR